MNLNEDGVLVFETKERVTARVAFCKIEQYKDTEATRCWGTMVVPHDGMEYEVTFSIAPWLGYLNECVSLMAADPGQLYEGFHMLSKPSADGRMFHNIMGIHGIAKPADWDAQCVSMGLQSNRPPANNKPPKAVPGAKASATEEEM